MFNKKQKIISLEDALKRQSVLLSEKESELRLLQQRVAYAEGRLDSSKEMILVLKEQLKEEMLRSQQLQKTFILQQAVNGDKFTENLSQLFEEDESTIEKIHKELNGSYEEEGDL